MSASAALVNIHDYERAAAARLDPGVLGYFAGGAADELTLRDNVAAFARLQLRPRVLVDVSAIDPSTTVLGRRVELPVLVAPVAFQRLVHPDGELAMARAAAGAGTAMVLSTLASALPAEVAAAAPGSPRWMQVYVFRDRAITQAIVDEAAGCGYQALVLTVDAPRAGRRERDFHTGFALPAGLSVPSVDAALGGGASPSVAEVFGLIDESLVWADVERLAASSPLPLVLKGIQTAEDAALACECGAAAIVVSNHGGRQLDGVAATIDLLPEIVEAVGGRIEVLLDGGIRRGTDVLKAIALGARAVLAGRAPLWGLAVDGQPGATAVLAILRAEIENALTLLGVRALSELGAEHVAPART